MSLVQDNQSIMSRVDPFPDEPHRFLPCWTCSLMQFLIRLFLEDRPVGHPLISLEESGVDIL